MLSLSYLCLRVGVEGGGRVRGVIFVCRFMCFECLGVVVVVVVTPTMIGVTTIRCYDAVQFPLSWGGVVLSRYTCATVPVMTVV